MEQKKLLVLVRSLVLDLEENFQFENESKQWDLEGERFSFIKINCTLILRAVDWSNGRTWLPHYKSKRRSGEDIVGFERFRALCQPKSSVLFHYFFPNLSHQKVCLLSRKLGRVDVVDHSCRSIKRIIVWVEEIKRIMGNLQGSPFALERERLHNPGRIVLP